MFLLTISFLKTTAQEYNFNKLSQANGLASNFVHALWQDQKGFLWIGSDNGLQRYDGRSFFSPHLNTGTELPYATVNQILSDGKGRMWLRLNDIVGVFDPGSFQFRRATIHFEGKYGSGSKTTLRTDVNGRMYLLLPRKTILYFDETSFSFDKKYTPYELPEDWLPTAVFEDSIKQQTWIGFAHGIGCYDWKSKELWHKDYNPRNLPLLNFSGGSIRTLDIDKDRKFWITAWNNKQIFFCYDEKQNRFTNETAGLLTNEERGYYEMERIALFSDSIRLAYGINVFQVYANGRFQHMEERTPPGSFDCESVEQVFEDREGIIWVASDNGLYNLTTGARKTTRFQLPRSTGISFNAACQLPDGDILLNGFGHGIFRFDEKLAVQRPGIIRPSHPDGNYQNSWTIFSNLADSTVWIGCQYGRLIVYEFKTGRMNYYHPQRFNNGTMTRVMADDLGYLWIGLSNGDIFRWKQGSSMRDETFELMSNVKAAVTEMFQHTDGNIYIGTRGAGVSAISIQDGSIRQQYTTTSATALSTNHIGDLCRINDSIICLTGDVANIVNLKTGKVTQLTRYNDEIIGEPYVQIQDVHGDIWFVSTNGIYRYNYASGFLQKFTQWEGLNVPHSTIAVLERRRLRNGNILLAGNLNAMLFDPENYRSADKPANVMISNFKVGNTYLPLDSVLSLKTITLNRNDNTLAISFSIPGFSRPNRNLYQYQLEGADKDWVQAGNGHEARYSLLPPGSYTFRVRAQNEAGEYSETTTTMRIVVKQVFWKTGWFISLVIAAIALLSYYIHRLRIRQLLKVEKVRARLASDLHDDMGSTLSTINILSSIAANKVGNTNEEVSTHLKNIGQSSSRAMEAMDDIVWSINPRNDSMQKITARMREFASSSLEAKDIDFSFSMDEAVKDLKFDMEARRDIFLLFKEAVNNIVKYADAKTVKILLSADRRNFKIRIEDDGKGFDPKDTFRRNPWQRLAEYAREGKIAKRRYQDFLITWKRDGCGVELLTKPARPAILLPV
ncbi:MAG: histidine kinase [Chitinophagaceae bacterium]|nr:histidine kinase [Chitinophagaceae bacterium]